MRTTDLPLEPDPYGVWFDVQADRIDTEYHLVEELPLDFKAAFMQAQGYFNKCSGKACRGYFIKHNRNATWCSSPLCPSCWVKRQIDFRAFWSGLDADGWLIKRTDPVSVLEYLAPPTRFHDTFVSRKNRRIRLVAWWTVITPNPDFPDGWSAHRVGVFGVDGPPPVTYRAIHGEGGWTGVPIYFDDGVTFTTAWQLYVRDRDEAMCELRDFSRSPWQSVFYPTLGELITTMTNRDLRFGRTYQKGMSK